MRELDRSPRMCASLAPHSRLPALDIPRHSGAEPCKVLAFQNSCGTATPRLLQKAAKLWQRRGTCGCCSAQASTLQPRGPDTTDFCVVGWSALGCERLIEHQKPRSQLSKLFQRLCRILSVIAQPDVSFGLSSVVNSDLAPCHYQEGLVFRFWNHDGYCGFNPRKCRGRLAEQVLKPETPGSL